MSVRLVRFCNFLVVCAALALTAWSVSAQEQATADTTTTSAAPPAIAATAITASPADNDKLEKIITTRRRAQYCNNAAPTGSNIRRGMRCYIPRSMLERQQMELHDKEQIRDAIDISNQEQRERMDCEAMRGHANGATFTASCFSQ